MSLFDILTALHKEVTVAINDYKINIFCLFRFSLSLLCNMCCKGKGSAFAYLIHIMQGYHFVSIQVHISTVIIVNLKQKSFPKWWIA